jgi:hypothetical protein
MFSKVFKDEKNDRLGLLLAAAIFGLVGIVQLVRALAGLPVELAGYAVPIWPSIFVGVAALFMSFWLRAISYRH